MRLAIPPTATQAYLFATPLPRRDQLTSCSGSDPHPLKGYAKWLAKTLRSEVFLLWGCTGAVEEVSSAAYDTRGKQRWSANPVDRASDVSRSLAKKLRLRFLTYAQREREWDADTLNEDLDWPVATVPYWRVHDELKLKSSFPVIELCSTPAFEPYSDWKLLGTWLKETQAAEARDATAAKARAPS